MSDITPGVFTDTSDGLAPASGGGTSTFLRADGTWQATGGGGATATTVEVDFGSTGVTNGRFTITDAAITATSKVLCWQAPGPYTGKGTLADEADMDPLEVENVAPATGTALVKWRSRRSTTFRSGRLVPGGQNNKLNLTSQTDPHQDDKWSDMGAYSAGYVRGNFKFTYVVFS